MACPPLTERTANEFLSLGIAGMGDSKALGVTVMACCVAHPASVSSSGQAKASFM
jgi:hypothetical protein